MGKMGISNKITEARYYEIKAETKVPADDKASMEKFGIGSATCRKIRNTRNYSQYMASNYKRGYCTRQDELKKANNRINKIEDKFNDSIEISESRMTLILFAIFALIALILFLIALTVRS